MLVAGIFCVVVFAGYAAAFWGGGGQSRSPAADAAEAAAGPRRARPNFVLRDQQGRLTSLAQFRGQVVVLAFLDPECTQICPLTSQILRMAMRRLGPAAAGVQLLGINVNPEATTVADVAAYGRIHGMDAAAAGHWRFLTGSPAQLRRVWREFGVYVATPHGELVHQAAIVILGPGGREREAYITPMRYAGIPQQAAVLAAKVAPLLAGHPAAAADPLPQPPPLAPGQEEILAALGPSGRPGARQVRMGAGHPHLVCFLADWLRATADLPRLLPRFDAYGKIARRRGWPPPVIVDVLPTEPDARTAERRLGWVEAKFKIQTPIVADASGRIADGYGVQDLPWLALTAASGKILWHHDGWLSAAAMERQVAKAMRRSAARSAGVSLRSRAGARAGQLAAPRQRRTALRSHPSNQLDTSRAGKAAGPLPKAPGHARGRFRC